MTTAREVTDKVLRSFVPPPHLSISEWAEDNITVSSGNNRGMRFSRDFMPYQNEIMDCVTDPTIDRIVIRAAARSGKTFCITDIMAYFIAHDPQPILYMRPADADVQKFSKEELASLILNTPGIREKIDVNKATYDFLQYPGGSLRLVGCNSAGKLAGYGVKICLMDEIDKYLPIPGFGNPADLAEERTAEYALYGRKIIYISTPTAMGEGVDALYETRSDMRVFLVPCIHCGFEQELEFKNVKFDHCREALDDIYYECTGCHQRISDSQRLTMMRRGRWEATRPDRTGFAGFRLSRLYSPLATMESIVRDFLTKKDNYLTLRQFVNDVLGEAWDENKDVKASTNQLYNRREHFEHEVPRGVAFLTMGIDVQGNPDSDKSWLEYEVAGWGKDAEKWVIEHDLLYGSPSDPAIWTEVLRRASRQYQTWAGPLMGITRIGIDTQGGYTNEVKAFLRGRQPRFIGLEGKKNRPGAPLLTKRKNKKITSWEVGTDSAKDTIFAILGVNPLPGGAPTPNCYHFPDTLDEEYFQSLLSEKKVEKIVGGVKIKKYYQTRTRNEVLDLSVYNWFLYAHVRRTRPSLLEESLAELEAAAGAAGLAPVAPAPPAVAAPTITAPAEVRRVPDPVAVAAPTVQIVPAPPAPVPAPAAAQELSAREKYQLAMQAFTASIKPR
jgi:phage terminase large subunit GpA-like protein